MCFASQNFQNAWADVGASFEIEAERNHVECGAVHALREEILRRIGQVGTVLAQDVVKAKAEFEFGDEFEEREVDVAPHAHFQRCGIGVGAEQGLLSAGQIVHRCDAGNDIRPIVVETGT